MTQRAFPEVLSEDALTARLDTLAAGLAEDMREGDWTAVAILLGAMPFTTDLMKALARLGLHPTLDALWLESYKDARESSGRVSVRADISRPVAGRNVLLIDDVYDTGRTLAFARTHLLAKGAKKVVTCVLARKPGAAIEGLDHYAFDAPPRFLIGYGMDDAGRFRGLPYIGAVD